MLPFNHNQIIFVSANVVTIGTNEYTFATDADANAFAAIARESITAASEWYSGVRDLFRDLEKLMGKAAQLEAIYNANNLYPLVVATPSGLNVPGMGVSALRSIAVGALMQDLNMWLDAVVVGNPAAGVALPVRRTVIGKRD
jgi:hypothetical protein